MVEYRPVKTNVTAHKRTRPGKYHTKKTVRVRKYRRKYKKAVQGNLGEWKNDHKVAIKLQEELRREPDEKGCRLDGNEEITNMNQAECYLGGLSNVTKMPGFSWSISPMDCKTGMRLRGKPGSVCQHCYACKGRYVFGAVPESHANKLHAWQTDRARWKEAMNFALKNSKKVQEEPYFRFFDSGDVYNAKMLDDIAEVARKNPKVKFWIPTKEYKTARIWKEENNLPPNMVIRVSHQFVNQEFAPKQLKDYGHVSYVWDPKKPNKPKGFVCPAYKQKGECRKCRACWSKKAPAIIYKIH